jgi:peroxiredoxin/GNAT superfamily N-acetyltransferase
MTATCTIRAARLEDVPRLPAIELAAARLLAGHAPESVLNETTSLGALEKAQREGRLWVAVADGLPIGFAHVALIERGAVHLEEIDVHPDYGRRGLGSRMVRCVCEWAASHGYGAVTLTTFRDVPWNLPCFARCGFDVGPREPMSAALRAIVEDEARRGLDPLRRAVMKRPAIRPWNFVRSPGDSRHVMHTRLQNGDRFPDLSIPVVGGGTLVLPRDLEGSYSVILFYRGAWCPYCKAQLAAFARARESLRTIGVEIAALSVDDETVSAALVDRMRLNFPIGFGAKADEIAAATGAYVDGDGAYLQSTGFVLDRSGRILTAVYSSGAIGRLVPDDVAGFVRYVDSHAATNTPAVAGEQ